ncbi:MAG: YopX family protein [Prevotellaceae bacterium]|jgi:uncharacterized phage protein (TIGR01671 family)|nr:YopX family protein [Prevotellaceae bacterium]
MNRIIKFRGKRIDNGEWVCGYYVIIDKKHYIFSGEMGDFPVHPVSHWTYKSPIRYEVYKESVSQFTELYDRNGKEIYEGDIFEKTSRPRIYRRILDQDGVYKGEDYDVHPGVLIRFKVDWNCEDAYFDAQIIYVNPEGVKTGSTLVPRSTIEVGKLHPLSWYFNENKSEEIIGNIHDNPELLTAK